jgi:hypothetical protein
MSSFAFNLREYAKAAQQTIGEAVREIVVTVGTLVDERSPVGQPDIWASNIDRASRGLPPLPKGYIGGHFRANNQYKFGDVPDSEVEGEDPSGANAMAAIKAGVMVAPVSGVHYIANIVPYAEALENGHSTQAPQGVYGLAQLDMVNAAREILKEIE